MNQCPPSFLSFNDAVAALLADNNIAVDTEQVLLPQAVNRILATDISAPFDVPGYDNSAMDGYAFSYDDLQASGELELIGSAFAGHPFQGEWRQGGCIRIMTGAAVPAQCDTVVMQEQAIQQEHDNCTLVRFDGHLKRHQHVRKKGEDITTGTILFKRGQRLKATDIGILASIGIAQLPLYQPLKVAILSTGDELREPGTEKSEGEIYDTNRYTTQAILQNFGFEVIDCGIVPDVPEILANTFKRALSLANVVISSGGVSVGEADHTKTVLNELGSMQFWKVAIKPGKPFAYGHFHTQDTHGNNKRFMGLPGNPVSSVVTLHQLALPALRKMAGEHIEPQQLQRLPLASPISKKPGRLEFIRASIDVTASGTRVQPLQGQGSGILSTFSQSQGYVILSAEGSSWQENELVDFLPFDQALS